MSRNQALRTKPVRETVRRLEQAGIEVLAVNVAKRKAHLKITIATVNGPRTLFAPGSGSDQRSWRHMVSDARRLANGTL